MNKNYCELFLIVVYLISYCVSCSTFHSNNSEKKHVATFCLNPKTYIEKYEVYSGGATTTSVYSYYLTDSVNFRKYIGRDDPSYDDLFWILKDSVTVDFYRYLYNYEEIDTCLESQLLIKVDTIFYATYNINGLAKEKRFDN